MSSYLDVNQNGYDPYAKVPGLNKKQKKRLRRLKGMSQAGEAMTDKQTKQLKRLRSIRRNAKQQNKNPLPTAQAGEKAAAFQEARDQMKWQNAQQYNPFGQQTIDFDPVTGRPILKQSLSDNQQEILNQREQLSILGGNIAQQAMNNYQQWGGVDLDRERIENEMYNKYTRDLDREYGRGREQVEQDLANKGIAYSNDPDSRYQQMLGDFDRRYDEQRQNARQGAVEFGGQELQRQFNMGLQGHQQNLSDVATLQNYGTGLMLPQYQGYQAPGYNVASPYEMDIGYKTYGLNQQSTNANIAQGWEQLAIAAQNANTAAQAQQNAQAEQDAAGPPVVSA